MARKTFEGAMDRLEAIVKEMESGDLGLDEALSKFQEGIELSRFCSKKLDETEKKVSILLKDEDGNIQEQDFQVEG